MTEELLQGRYTAMPAIFAGNLPPNWGTDHFGVRVLLDGVELQDVIGFDTAAGEVCRYRRDEAGNLAIIPGKGEFVVETLKGEVIASAKAA